MPRQSAAASSITPARCIVSCVKTCTARSFDAQSSHSPRTGVRTRTRRACRSAATVRQRRSVPWRHVRAPSSVGSAMNALASRHALGEKLACSRATSSTPLAVPRNGVSAHVSARVEAVLCGERPPVLGVGALDRDVASRQLGRNPRRRRFVPTDPRRPTGPRQGSVAALCRRRKHQHDERQHRQTPRAQTRNPPPCFPRRAPRPAVSQCSRNGARCQACAGVVRCGPVPTRGTRTVVRRRATASGRLSRR